MSVFRRYSQAGGAVHDLSRIEGLSAERTIPLLLSPRVLYVLTNLVNLDLAFECRWAVALQQAGYLRLTTDDTEYATFLEVVSQAGRQLSEGQAGMGTVLNFKDTLLLQEIFENASAGANTLSVGGPGEGEAWVIQNVSAYNATSQSSYIFVRIATETQGVYIQTRISPLAGIPDPLTCQIHIAGALELKAVFLGCQAGDDLYLEVAGYVMDLVA